MGEGSENNRTTERDRLSLHRAVVGALLRHGPLDLDDNDDAMIADAVVEEVYPTGGATDLRLVPSGSVRDAVRLLVAACTVEQLQLLPSAVSEAIEIQLKALRQAAAPSDANEATEGDSHG